MIQSNILVDTCELHMFPDHVFSCILKVNVSLMLCISDLIKNGKYSPPRVPGFRAEQYLGPGSQKCPGQGYPGTLYWYSHLGYAALHCVLLYCLVMYCTLLYYTVIYCTLLHCSVLYSNTMHFNLLYGSAIQCFALHCIVLYIPGLHCFVVYSTAPCIQCFIYYFNAVKYSAVYSMSYIPSVTGARLRDMLGVGKSIYQC